MPRKINLCWGEDGFFDTEPLALTNEQAVELPALLGFEPDSPQATTLSAAVQEIGTCFRNGHKRGPAAFSRAQAYKALEDLLKREHLNHAALTGLNGRALDALLDAIHMMNSAIIAPGEPIYSALIENRLSEMVVRKAMHDAIRELKAQKGPERQYEIADAVAKLCRVYEEVTGKRATHSNKGERMGYQQEPKSEAGRFVHQCFRLIDKDVVPSQINRAMRAFIERHG